MGRVAALSSYTTCSKSFSRPEQGIPTSFSGLGLRFRPLDHLAFSSPTPYPTDNGYLKILSKLPYVLISQTSGQSNVDSEMGIEDVGARVLKKYEV